MDDPAASFAGCVYETARPRLHSERAQQDVPGTRIELVQWEPPRDFKSKSLKHTKKLLSRIPVRYAYFHLWIVLDYSRLSGAQ